MSNPDVRSQGRRSPVTVFLRYLFLALGLVIAASLCADVLAAEKRGLAPDALVPEELKAVDVRDHYDGHGTKRAAVVENVVGYAVVTRDGSSRAYYAAPGDVIFENDVIITFADSKCRVRLAGQDLVMMGQSTRVALRPIDVDPVNGTKSSFIFMNKGMATFYALSQIRYSRSTMTVETPETKTVANGPAKWGVEVVKKYKAQAAVKPILVAASSDLGFRLLAQANPPSPPQFQTTILCFSGTVFTGSTAPPPPGAPPPPMATLSQGQMTTVGSGSPPAPPAITPPSLVNSLTAGTFLPLPSSGVAYPPPSQIASSLSFSTDAVSAPTGSGTSSSSPPTIVSGSSLSATPGTGVQMQQQLQVQQAQGTETPDEPMTSIQKMASSWGPDLAMSFPLNMYEVAGGTKGAVEGPSLDMRTQYPSPALPPNGSKTGGNAYLEWGSWDSSYEEPDGFGGVSTVPGQTFYVSGGATTDNQINALRTQNMVGTYSGTSFGVIRGVGIYSETQGSFSTTINFGSSAITNFNLNMTGGGNTAIITNGAGTLGNNGGAGSFRVTSGTATVNALPATEWNATGRVYGNQGQAVGGNFWIKNNNGAAAGVYQGTR